MGSTGNEESGTHQHKKALPFFRYNELRGRHGGGRGRDDTSFVNRRLQLGCRVGGCWCVREKKGERAADNDGEGNVDGEGGCQGSILLLDGLPPPFVFVSSASVLAPSSALPQPLPQLGVPAVPLVMAEQWKRQGLREWRVVSTIQCANAHSKIGRLLRIPIHRRRHWSSSPMPIF